jgi:hypothetical protein
LSRGPSATAFLIPVSARLDDGFCLAGLSGLCAAQSDKINKLNIFIENHFGLIYNPNMQTIKSSINIKHNS